MKKTITYIYSMFLFMVLFVSCDSETIHIQDMEGKVVRLTLSSPELTTSRVMSRTEAGTGTENYIDNIRCFFYKSTDGNDVAATYVYPDSIEVEGTYAGTGISVQIPLPSTEYDLLFPEGTTKCRIYVIANLPTGVKITNTDINSLKALEVKAEEFTAEGVKKEDGSITFSQPVSFVMDGDATIELKEDALSGNVPLTRSAAKIGLFVNVVTDITDTNGATWVSKPTGMLIRIHKGVKNGLIDGLADDGTSTYPNPRDYYTSAPLGDGTRIFVQSNNGQGNNVYEHHPFYSYPSEWKNRDENETYLELIVPWKKTKNADGTTTTKTEFEDCFYQIPINVEGKELLRNTYYKINLHVGMLGSFTPDEPVVLAPSSYIVVDWGTGDVSAKFEEFSFLIVDHLTKVYNENSVTIPFASSHEAEITSFTISQPDLSDGSTRTTEEISQDINKPTYTIDNVNKTITYSKTLINDFKDENFDFTPYTITFTLRHTSQSGGGLSQTNVTIIQYPAIYGERNINSDATNGGDNNGNNGYAFVNGYQKDGKTNNWPKITTQASFDNVKGLSGGDVTSQTMLVFTVTTTAGTNYVIGDPRETSVNNFISETHVKSGEDVSIWATAPALGEEKKRILQYYYATETNNEALKNSGSNNVVNRNNDSPFYTSRTEAESKEKTYNMLAPKFRISSGYGQINTNGDRRYYHLMKKRCASYQEDGYPAGRWRLPTKAELEFIFYLSDKGKIPTLFDDDMDYWCAHGYARPSTSNTADYKVGEAIMGFYTDYNNSNYISVRCVYDDWYWGSQPALSDEQKKYFTWGDQMR